MKPSLRSQYREVAALNRQSQPYIEHAVANDVTATGQKRAGTATESTDSPRIRWTVIASTVVVKATTNAMIATVAVK
jgi:hypothetical protein